MKTTDIKEFDEFFTVPMNGFENIDDFYDYISA